ncbi:beta-ketoacyl synthase [Flavobacterium sp. GT3R68]|uniref:beta-ketoacyl-[acyl-carrier-protein] synthase family protein n=1 Tax=Flavobacterium sp. GT3R68 TaxID=2594437 RepID=UPI000F897FA7|nr:beta-ketoacyl-[acyl-carrier-protein] synthase family protein [Flavobacterium sp. GT3R68]RTY89359.1 beta-ketoacyl-[acyl-carrier-protein] synthase family protein [Flavobacterium sp. GSN2]TRW93919.1 beta-ketoacyl-[acyl-carrier-protein] synthase family protein [Flavobacterium sp. GT3R68]
MQKRIVVTGIGILSSIGNNIQEHLDSLLVGKSGKKNIERINTAHPIYRNQSACIIDQEKLNSITKLDKTKQINCGIFSIDQAINDAKLTPGDLKEAALIIGTSIGASHTFADFFKEYITDEKLSEEALDLASNSAQTITGSIAKHYKISGPTCTISTACSASTNAVGRGLDMIRSGKVKIAIAGGVDIFSELAFSGFNCLQALSKSDCKPFSSTRDGLMLGDASAFLILEEYESAKSNGKSIYAEVVSYHFLNEAYHPTAVKEDGSSIYDCMKQTLNKANLTVDDINYINAHGTATNVNDSTELKGIELLLDEAKEDNELYVSSTKSMIGHCLGAAGSAELVSTILGMKYNFILPNINVEPHELLKINNSKIKIPSEATGHKITYALSNSFAFGGNMSSILIKNMN